MSDQEKVQQEQLMAKGPWGQLSRDPELLGKGVEFILFNFGAIYNDGGQVVDILEIPPIYQERVKYAPYLELRLPNDMTKGVTYQGDRQEWRNVKKWILQQLETPEFKTYKENVDRGSIEATTRADIRKDMEDAINAPKPNQVQTPARNPQAATVSGMGTQPTPKIVQMSQIKKYLPK
jgi:hypothetical protein